MGMGISEPNISYRFSWSLEGGGKDLGSKIRTEIRHGGLGWFGGIFFRIGFEMIT